MPKQELPVIGLLEDSILPGEERSFAPPVVDLQTLSALVRSAPTKICGLCIASRIELPSLIGRAACLREVLLQLVPSDTTPNTDKVHMTITKKVRHSSFFVALVALGCQPTPDKATQPEPLHAIINTQTSEPKTPTSTGATISPQTMQSPSLPTKEAPALEVLFDVAVHNPHDLPDVSARVYAQIEKAVYPKAKIKYEPCEEGDIFTSKSSVFERPYVDPLIQYTAEGSFTEPNTKQTLYLIASRECGSDRGTTVVAIFEGKKLVDTFISEYEYISRVLDINGDGLLELLFYGGNDISLFGLETVSPPKIKIRKEGDQPFTGEKDLSYRSEPIPLFKPWVRFVVSAHESPIYGLPTRSSRGPMAAPSHQSYEASVYYEEYQSGSPLTFVVKPQ